MAVIALETTNQLAKNENIKATILPFIFRLMTVPTMAEISKLCPKIMYHVYKKIWFKYLCIHYTRVNNLRSDTFGNPIFQNVLQN